MSGSHNAVGHNQRMVEPHTCYSAYCDAAIRWRVVSLSGAINPDGSPLALFACDRHEPALTAELRRAGTKYQLMPASPGPEADPSLGWLRANIGGPAGPIRSMLGRTNVRSKEPLLFRVWPAVMFIVMMTLIGPFIFCYYGVKWLFGWRPPTNE